MPQTFWSKLMTGIRAFRDSFVTTNLSDPLIFGDYESRRMRYQIMWSFYESSVYRNVHRWAESYRATYGLYKYIRNIYNPAYRLGEFWKSHLFGGPLDGLAGNGSVIPTAIPLVVEDSLRPAIALIFKWSNWRVYKDVMSLWGAVLGDVAIRVVDDPVKKRVYLKLQHPSTIEEVTLDDWGNIKGYILREERTAPGSLEKSVYTEKATREGENVVYETLLNGKPYGDEPIYSTPYGFIPMVMIQHNNVGLEWGWSEIFPVLSKIREADDIASKLSDQIRKSVDAPWMFTGVTKPNAKKTTTESTPTDANPEPGREEIPAIYGPAGASATPLVAPLDIGASSAYITTILESIEYDYPELALDLRNIQGDISGRALRVNRGPAEDKVLQRRTSYDDGLSRALQMALSIGGMQGYPGFEMVSINSYEVGALELSIGERPVFGRDVLDQIEAENALWTAARAAKEAGLPLQVFLKRQNWTEEELAVILQDPEYQAKMEAMQTSALLGGLEREPADRTAIGIEKDE